VNPYFGILANHVEQAANELAAARDAAKRLHFPELNFMRVEKLLRRLAEDARRELLWKAFTRHFQLTDAPGHPDHRVRSRAGKMRRPPTAEALRFYGALGGRSKSRIKQLAAQENGKLGGRPKRRGTLGASGLVAKVSAVGTSGPLSGVVTSERKAMAARINGKKGGRPKKRVQTTLAFGETDVLPIQIRKQDESKRPRLLIGKVKAAEQFFGEV